MADFFKGLSGGLQAGLQLGQAMRDRKQRDELAQAFNPAESFLDYTPEGQQKIQSFQDSGGYDVSAIPGAEGQAPTLRYTPKQGLDLQGDSPAAPVDIAPQQVQRYGNTTVTGKMEPMKLQGLQMREAARIIAANGDPVKAAQLQADADELDYKAQIRPMELERTTLGLKKGKLELADAERQEAERQRETDFSAFAAENPNATTQELKDAAFTQFKFSPKQWQSAVNTRLGIEETDQKLFKTAVQKKLRGKNLQQLGSLYNTDSDFDDKTDLAIVPGKGGAVTLNFIDKASGKITGSQAFTNEALATEYLNKQATEPETLGSWMLALREKEASIKSKDANTAESNAKARLYGEGGSGGGKDIQKKIAGIEKVLDRKLTPEEKATLVGLTNKPREVSAADVNARAKLLIDGGMTDPDDPTKPLSPQQAIAMATAELSGQKYTSPIDDLINKVKENQEAEKNKAKKPAQVATPAGQQLLDLRGQLNPPRPAPVYTPPAAAGPTQGLLPQRQQRSYNGSF